MPRQPRTCVENGIYHVFSHGVDGRTIVRDDWDFVALLAGMETACELHEWKLLAFCVLGTHHHFLLRTPHADLSQGMWRVNIGFARWFNNRYGTKGHVFDRRYGARLIAGDEHLQEVVRYIALNPVEAGCCDLPEQWPWSSYAGVLGLAPRPPIVDVEELLSHFGDAEDARARLRAFVEDGLARRVA